MLILESYKSLNVDLKEVAMTRANGEFDRAGPTGEREETRRDAYSPRRHAPADQLMYAWSIQVGNDEPEARPTERHLEECPPEVYIG